MPSVGQCASSATKTRSSKGKTSYEKSSPCQCYPCTNLAYLRQNWSHLDQIQKIQTRMALASLYHSSHSRPSRNCCIARSSSSPRRPKLWTLPLGVLRTAMHADGCPRRRHLRIKSGRDAWRVKSLLVNSVVFRNGRAAYRVSSHGGSIL